MLSIENKIEQLESLPPFPLLSNILKSFLVADSDGDIRPLINNIETEPSITAKIIGMANSAFFASGNHIHTIRDATARLGLLQLKSIVYSLILSSRFKTKQCPHFEISRFWLDSMLQAHCARIICEHVTFAHDLNKNELYVLGLLQRIGILAFVDLDPEQMDFILASEDGVDLQSKEQRYFKLCHYDAGARLLKHWSLPAEFYSTLSNYNNSAYDGEYVTALNILKKANELVTHGSSVNNNLNVKLGLDERSIHEILKLLELESTWVRTFAGHL